MESSRKKIILRTTGIKLFQDTRSPSKRNVCILIRCNNTDHKILAPPNSEVAPCSEFITLKGPESSPVNIKVYGSEVTASSNLLGELNLLLGALAQEDGSQPEWKQLTKLGKKIGEILIEVQTEAKADSDESFYSSKSKPESINKDSDAGKSISSEPNQDQNKSINSSTHNSQESHSIDQKQPSEGSLSENNRSKGDAAPNQVSDSSIVSCESSNQKQNSVQIQVEQTEDKAFQPFKGLVQLSNGGEFFKASNANQDIYLDIMEPEEKPKPKKPMGVAKWMVYIAQLVNPSLNY